MGILPAVLPYPRNVSFDIAWIQVRCVERRVQELDKVVVPPDKKLVHRFHCPAGAFRFPGAGENRPALRKGIDAAFGIACRTQNRTVVEVSAPIPLAVPTLLLDVPAETTGFLPAAFNKWPIAMEARNLRKS
jgi:hypothetical protein